MALSTFNITDELKDALGVARARGRVTFRPLASSDARTDPSTGDVLLGTIVEDIETLPTPYPLTAGAWRITIESTSRVHGRPEFSPIVVSMTLDRDYKWQEIVDRAVTAVPVTATQVEQAQAAAAEAEMWASTAEGVQDTAVSTLVSDGTSATSAALSATIEAGVRTPATHAPTTPTFAGAFTGRPAWMSADGTILWGYDEATLRDSTDDGATWRAVHTFARPVSGVRQMPDGELLVGVEADNGASIPGEVWRSTGYSTTTDTETWTKVLTMNLTSAPSNWYSWGAPLHHLTDLPDGVNMGILTLGEYGSQADPAPKVVWLTEDYGQTWRTIYDPGSRSTYHHHGTAYDPWGDAMWMSTGDGAANARIAYSTDWRNATPTWTDIPLGTATQGVGIWPMRGCILIGNDGIPNGTYRVDRLPDGGYGALVTTDNVFDPHPTLTTYVRTMYQRPGGPVLLGVVGIADTTDEALGHVQATFDGRTFHTLLSDGPYVTTSGIVAFGPYTALGPSASGKIVGHIVDHTRGLTPEYGSLSHGRYTMPEPRWITEDPVKAAKDYADKRIDTRVYGAVVGSPYAAMPLGVASLSDRRSVNTANWHPRGVLVLTYFTSPIESRVRYLRMVTGSTAATSPTLCRMGLYKENRDGSLTLVASTANDTTMFAAANTDYKRAVTTPYNLEPGQRYAMGGLVVGGSTDPTFAGIANAGFTRLVQNGSGPILALNYTGQTDLPASFATPTSTYWANGGIYVEALHT